MAISDQLTSINTSKLAIKAALTAKGLTPSNTLSTYAGNIDSLSTGVSDAWVRPADWLPMPTVLATEQKFVGLYAVFPNDNFAESSNNIALQCWGNYTVYWGDGVVEDYNQSVIAYHTYDYNAISSTTACSRGYRQVLVIVVPQSGLNLFNFSLQASHFRLGLATGNSTGWLDMTLSMPSAHSAGYAQIGGAGVAHNCLEQVTIKTLGNISSTQLLFAYCRSLVSVPLFDTSKITNANQMFRANTAIKTIPGYDFSSVANLSNFCISASALVTIGAITTSTALTNTSGMFSGCTSLVSIPLFVTSSVADASNMFTNSAALPRITDYNFSSVTNASNMFSNCYALQSIPNYNFNNVTNATNMFATCNSLQSIPDYNFNNVLIGNLVGIFNNCNSLTKTGAINLKFTHSYSACKLSPNALTTILNNLPTVASAQTINILNNWGASPVYTSSSLSTTSGSKDITLTGGQLTTIGYLANNIIRTANGNFGWLLGTKITLQTSLNAAVPANTIYYIVETVNNGDYRISLTQGGPPIAFSVSGSGVAMVIPLGCQVTGIGSPLTTPIAVAFTGNKVTLNNHQLQLGDKVIFPSIVTTTGLATYTPYYIVGIPTAGAFEISGTSGGTAIIFTDGAGTMLYDSIVESISGTTHPFTIKMTRPMTANTTTGNAMVFRQLKTSIALFKNWTVA